jgi:hypothetical protein
VCCFSKLFLLCPPAAAAAAPVPIPAATAVRSLLVTSATFLSTISLEIGRAAGLGAGRGVAGAVVGPGRAFLVTTPAAAADTGDAGGAAVSASGKCRGSALVNEELLRAGALGGGGPTADILWDCDSSETVET